MQNSISYWQHYLLQETEEKELSPKQKKIAKLDPPADELDAGDFAALRAGKKIKEDHSKKADEKIDASTKNFLQKIYKDTAIEKIPEKHRWAFEDDSIKTESQDHIKTRVGGIVFKKTGNTNGSKVEYQPYSLIDKKNVDTAFYYHPEDIQQKANDYTAPKGGTQSTQFESEDHEVSMANNSLETIIKHAMELKAKLGDDEKDIPAWIQDHITNAANFISQAAENYHEYSPEEGGEEKTDDEIEASSLEDLMEEIIKSKKKKK